jgi:hypothetical protein
MRHAVVTGTHLSWNTTDLPLDFVSSPPEVCRLDPVYLSYFV